MTATPMTGRKVFLIAAGFFTVVIGVNLTLAVQAVRTFPGIEVDNSYIASQRFNAEKLAQDGLGWKLEVHGDARQVSLGFTDPTGQTVHPAMLSASIGRATEASDDSIPAFEFTDGAYRAPVALAPGKWVLRVEARDADGTAFRQRISVFVEG